MKRFLLPVLIFAAVLAGGCDTVRTLSGRPTAAQLEAKRQHIVDSLTALRRQAAEDSARLAAAAKVEVDTLALQDTLRQWRIPMHNRKRIGGVSREPEHRYYIVTGAFYDPKNAERSAGRYSEAGYDASVVAFRNGLYAVGVGGSDRLSDVFDTVKRMRRNGFCPSGMWIFINE